ncbi:MAG TPA: S41 family peptidase [Solirubrobacteraceae bacterium]|nr:S41 family peptidase [Solirubrobacteraceae bacterium]
MLGGILAAIVLVLVGIWLGGHPSALPAPLRAGVFESRRGDIATEQALNILTSQYFRPLKRSTLVDLGLSGMVAGLDDPYSHYIDPSSYRSRNEPETPRIGIGIDIKPEAEGLRITGVVEGSPAARAGIRQGDLIVKVGSTSLADRGEDYGLDRIRGREGTTVTLTVKRGETDHVFSVVRAPIMVPVTTSRILNYDGVRLGYLRLTGFSEGAGDKLRAEVQAAMREHARGLILDLRGNGGGLIGEAINVASIFLAHGTIMSAEQRGQPPRVYTARDDAIAPDTPLVVLVDKGTASSAEIVTAALQDHGRAKVVGTRTYGKGVFQQTQRLVNGGALDITIGQFFTPNGHNLGDGVHHGTGIVPNVEAPEDSHAQGDEALAVAERTVVAEGR